VEEDWSLVHPLEVAGELRRRRIAGNSGGGETLGGVSGACADLDVVERRGGRRRARGTAEGRRGGLHTRMVAGGEREGGVGRGRRRTAN
jgi:hypothetical protein